MSILAPVGFKLFYGTSIQTSAKTEKKREGGGKECGLGNWGDGSVSELLAVQG